MKPSESPGAALARLITALVRLFEALDPRGLTKNQRFTLACNMIVLIFFAGCLLGGLDRNQKFVLALSVLLIIFWSHRVNFKS